MSNGEGKIAIAVVHGVGLQDEGFAQPLERMIRRRLAEQLQTTNDWLSRSFIFDAVHWTPEVQVTADALWQRAAMTPRLGFRMLRRFVVDYATDAIAYERNHPSGVYARVHARITQTLTRLAQRAGPQAPLCVVAHSLGCVIASNFFWDLQRYGAPAGAPLVRGDTLASFITTGCPLAYWSLRYPDFGVPIEVPSPRLGDHHLTQLPRAGGWLNLYDAEDVIGAPLKSLNDHYTRVVREDRVVRVGGPITTRTPFVHADFLYWRSPDVADAIVTQLVQMWRAAYPHIRPEPHPGGPYARPYFRMKRWATDGYSSLETPFEWARLVRSAVIRARGAA